MKVALQHLHNEPLPLRPLRPDLPPETEPVVLRALAKQSNQRYMSAGEFAGALRQTLEEAGVMLEPQVVEVSPRPRGERPTGNRRRSLFDPFWRNPPHTPPVNTELASTQQAEGQEAVGAGIIEHGSTEKGEPAAQVATGPDRQTTTDIVSKRSVSQPLLSSLVASAGQVVRATRIRRPTKAIVTKFTPPPETRDQDQNMENTPFYQKPAQNMPSPVPPGADNGATGQNNQFSRLRLGNKPNQQGNVPNNPGPQIPFAPQPQGQTGVFGNYGAGQPSPAANASFWSQAETGNQASFPQGGNGFGAANQFGQPGSPMAQPNAGAPGAFNSFGGQPGTNSPFNGQRNPTGNLSNFGGQPGMGATGTFNTYSGQPQPQSRITGSLTYGRNPTGSLVNPSATGALQVVPGNDGTGQTGMLKLTQSVKVVKVPVAGQPGQYVTGLLPVLPGAENEEAQESPEQRRKKKIQMIALLAAVAIVIFGSLAFLLSHQQSPTTSTTQTPPTQNNLKAQATANAQATAGAKATAAAQANTILIDPLSSNAHNWATGTLNGQDYTFKDGAYHIRVNVDQKGAAAVLPDPTPPDTFAYSLTMQRTDGADDDNYNRFGLVIRFNQGSDTTFYSFMLADSTDTPLYLFQKFDQNATPQYPTTPIWSATPGNECHLGKGQTNTFKIVAQKDHFTFFVNGTQVGTAQDGTYANGQVGMVVNEKGTDVAFTNLVLTHQ